MRKKGAKLWTCHYPTIGAAGLSLLLQHQTAALVRPAHARQERHPEQVHAQRGVGNDKRLDIAHGDLTVVNVPLAMATMPGEFRVAFHNDDATVSGLYFLKTGVPIS